MTKGGDTTKKEKGIVFDVPLKDISTDGKKVVIDSPKLAEILEAEKEAKDHKINTVILRPIVPAFSLKEVSTTGKKVTITSQELSAIVQAEKDAQTKKMSVVAVPNDPTPEPALR